MEYIDYGHINNSWIRTNLAFKSQMKILFPQAPEITFLQWSSFAFPQAVTFLLIIWLFFCIFYVRNPSELEFDKDDFRRQYNSLGKMTFAEGQKIIVSKLQYFIDSNYTFVVDNKGVVLADLIIVALLWLTRARFSDSAPGWQVLFQNYPGDGTVSILGALVLFLIPAFHHNGLPGQRILDWDAARDLQWGIVILLGSGFAIAQAFVGTGLSVWIGNGLLFLRNLHPFFMVLCVSTIVAWVTEFASNTAVTNISLPVNIFISFLNFTCYPLFTFIS